MSEPREDEAIIAVQVAMKNRLLADAAYFAPVGGVAIPVNTEGQGDLENDIERQLGEIGLSVVIITPAGKGLGPAPALTLDVEMIVQIAETPIVNRGPTGTGKTALGVAVRVVRHLHGWSHMVNLGKKFSVLAGNPTKPFEMIAATTDRVAYEVPFTTAVNLSQPAA